MQSLLRSTQFHLPTFRTLRALSRPHSSSPSLTKPDRVYTSVQISLPDEPGTLGRALPHFYNNKINLTRIESRRPKEKAIGVTIFCEFEGLPTEPRVQNMLQELKKDCLFVSTLDSYEAPYFPKKLSDMDKYTENCKMAGSDLDADHPGFNDQVYRKRREMIAEIALNYKTGRTIPQVEYTDQEKQTWNYVYTNLMKFFETHTCSQYQYVFPLLIENCGYRSNNIPQLQDVSDFLKEQSGFTIRPITGLLSSREFLNGLAFRVFFSTQYIRHHAKPDYTPEPDICHELLGHVPLFADPEFADFSQEIGLASLGVSDDAIERLSTLYWFTVEFGICKQRGKLKAYGAGLLSSFGEIEYALSDKPVHQEFDPVIVSTTKYPITKYQPVYFVTESFEHMKKQVREFGETLGRPFALYYNPYSQTIQEGSYRQTSFVQNRK